MRTRQKAKEPAKTGKPCLKNASELLEEADLLLANGHHRSACFLAYTAMEELGKSRVVADYFYDMVSKAEFEAAFRDHRFKAANVKRYVRIPDDLEGDWFIEYDPRSTGHYTQECNRSLSIEHRPDHSPKLSAQMISLESGNELIATAKKNLSEIIEMEHIAERIGTKVFTKWGGSPLTWQ